MQPAKLFSGFVQVSPAVDPATISKAATGASRIQFDRPLPEAHLAAIAQALRDHPDVAVRAYGREVDPSLEWLRHFRDARHLFVDLWLAESFEPIRALTELFTLGLGETKSKKPSLSFLGDLPKIEKLWIEGHEKGFAAAGSLDRLKFISLRANPLKSLECLAGHKALEGLWISFGGLRDLSPLSTMPNLRDVSLHRIRLLGDVDLAPLSKASRLEALELQDLRNVSSLAPLGPHPSIRFLEVEGLPGVQSFEPLSSWENLEYLSFFGPRIPPLMPLRSCPRLQSASFGPGRIGAEDLREFLAGWKGEVFWNGGKYHKGQEVEPHFADFWKRVDHRRAAENAP